MNKRRVTFNDDLCSLTFTFKSNYINTGFKQEEPLEIALNLDFDIGHFNVNLDKLNSEEPLYIKDLINSDNSVNKDDKIE